MGTDGMNLAHSCRSLVQRILVDHDLTLQEDDGGVPGRAYRSLKVHYPPLPTIAKKRRVVPPLLSMRAWFNSLDADLLRFEQDLASSHQQARVVLVLNEFSSDELLVVFRHHLRTMLVFLNECLETRLLADGLYAPGASVARALLLLTLGGGWVGATTFTYVLELAEQKQAEECATLDPSVVGAAIEALHDVDLASHRNMQSLAFRVLTHCEPNVLARHPDKARLGDLVARMRTNKSLLRRLELVIARANAPAYCDFEADRLSALC